MRQNIEEHREKLRFDHLIKFLDEKFQQIPEHRASNTKYRLAEVLKSAFAMFSLKSPSLLAFKRQTTAEQSNLCSIYRLAGHLAGDTQMREILDQLEPVHVRAIFGEITGLLERAGVIREYRFWEKKVLLSVDGVEHFSSRKVHCPNCTTKTLRSGETSYQHSGLGAVIVHPQKREVFPIEFEAIIKQDGERKNDCERNAAKRLCVRLNQDHPELEILLVEDALYANAPHIRQITGYGWSYILNIKPDSHKSLFKQFEGRKKRGQVKCQTTVDERGTEHYYEWTNQLWLCDTALDVKVNLVLYEERKITGARQKMDLGDKLTSESKNGAKSDGGRTSEVEDRKRNL